MPGDKTAIPPKCTANYWLLKIWIIWDGLHLTNTWVPLVYSLRTRRISDCCFSPLARVVCSKTNFYSRALQTISPTCFLGLRTFKCKKNSTSALIDLFPDILIISSLVKEWSRENRQGKTDHNKIAESFGHCFIYRKVKNSKLKPAEFHEIPVSVSWNMKTLFLSSWFLRLSRQQKIEVFKESFFMLHFHFFREMIASSIFISTDCQANRWLIFCF